MKLKQFLLLLFSIIILVFGLMGCAIDVTTYVDNIEDNAPLSMYLVGRGWKKKSLDDILDEIIYEDYRKMFNYKRSRKLKFKIFNDAETMYNQITKEMYAGRGPDIIVINSLSSHYLDLYKASQQDAFTDMDILIENSESFNLNDYNPLAMDTGIINGKRIMIPMGYNVNFSVGIKECFNHYNLEIPDKLTLESYLDTIEEYYSKTDMPVLLGIDEACLLSQFFDMGELIEGTDELRRLLDIFKTERERKISFPIMDLDHAEWPTFSFLQAHGWVYNNKLLFLGQVGQWESIPSRRFHLQYNTIEAYWDQEMQWFPQPFKENQPVEAFVEYGFVINNNSKHKNEAFEFIEYVLSEIKQSTVNIIHNPIRKDSFDIRKHEFAKGLDISCEDPGFGRIGHPDWIPDEKFVPKEMMEEFSTYLESAEEFEYIGQFKYIYYNIMQPSIEDYYKGYITFDALINDINSKLKIYYSE